MRPEVTALVQKIAKEVGVNPEHALLLLERETGSQKDPLTAVSDTGALGPLQVMPQTGEALAKTHGFDFGTPEGQTRAGLHYWKGLMDEFQDPAVAAAAYHSGPTRVRGLLAEGKDLATELGPVGRDYYSWFKERTAPQPIGPTGAGTSTDSIQQGLNAGLEGLAQDDASDLLGDPVDDLLGPEQGEEPAPMAKPEKPMVPFKEGWRPDEAHTPAQVAENVAETLPAAGSIYGGITGGPGGAALGGGGGEAARQLIRRMLGLPPATGFVQELTGQDPNSPGAALTGIAAEAGGAALGEKAVPFVLEKLFGGAKVLREKALRAYASALNPKPLESRSLEHTVEALRPIQDKLPFLSPFDPRKQLEQLAEARGARAGEVVGDIYNVDTPSSFDPVIQRLREAHARNVKYPPHEVPVTDEFGAVIDTEMAPAVYRNPSLAGELLERIGDMTTTGERARTLKGGATLQDLFESRKDTDELIRLAKTDAFTKKAGELKPRVRALKEQRKGLAEQLHKQTEVTPAEAAAGELSGEQADAIFSAWKTAEAGAKRSDPGTFPIRWAMGRVIPGLLGTSAGFLSTKPLFWASLSSTARRSLAKAYQAGDVAMAQRILRAAASTFEDSNSQEKNQ